MAWRKGDSQFGRVARLAAGALVSASAFVLATAPAEAHRYRHLRHYAHNGHYAHYGHHARYGYVAHYGRHAVAIPSSPAFSATVVDANSGRTLFAVADEGLRHPASITKVMTLYLLFQQLDRGAMTLETRIPISEHAAAQEPSKLGLAPGETIKVDDAIKAVVTRSANDIAVAIAEAVGHDESNFAEMMTQKAHALGMESTVYRNASGLPNDEQVTTARDLTVLARSLEERFPRYFKYFSTHEFEYAGEVIGNHNHLLGRVDGVDGIKTGYTRASGFNLLTSVHRDGRSLIAVVMGGRSAGARDRIMENLIADHIAEASPSRTATMVADTSASEESAARATQQEPPARPRQTVVEPNVPARTLTGRAPQPEIAEGDDSDEGDEPTLHVTAVPPPAKPHPLQAPLSAQRPVDAKAADAVTAPAQAQRTPAGLGWVKGPQPASSEHVSADAHAPAPPAKPKGAETIAMRVPAKEVDSEDAEATHAGWMIQIGATDDAAKANALLIRARQQNRSALAAAKPVTEKVRKGEDTFYRARFAGLDPVSAESACRSLKRNGFSCFMAHD